MRWMERARPLDDGLAVAQIGPQGHDLRQRAGSWRAVVRALRKLADPFTVGDIALASGHILQDAAHSRGGTSNP